MKKIINLIIEINNASFAWYVVLGILLYGMTYAYPAVLQEKGIPVWGIIWFLAVSVLLKAYDIFFRKQTARAIGKRAMQKIIQRLRLIALCVGGSIIILWALFAYGANKELYALMKNARVPILWSGSIFFILYWCVIVSASTKKEEKNEKTESDARDIKKIYANRQEQGNTTRLSEQFSIRKYAHETEYRAITALVQKWEQVLDVGCGDGTLAILLAKKGAVVTACDISSGNIAAAQAQNERNGMSVAFLIADAEHLPFPDNSFDCVVSSHVLEHLSVFEKGLAELRRVTKKRAVIAMPTCLNPCAAILLGDDAFWTFSRWSISAWFVGIVRIFVNLGGTGVNEWYGGDERLPHLWRYPWVMRREIKKGKLRITRFQASSFVLPYMQWLIPVSRSLEKYRALPIMRNFGYGSIAVVEK